MKLRCIRKIRLESIRYYRLRVMKAQSVIREVYTPASLWGRGCRESFGSPQLHLRGKSAGVLQCHNAITGLAPRLPYCKRYTRAMKTVVSLWNRQRSTCTLAILIGRI